MNSKESFILEATEVHGTMYLYNDVEYTNVDTKVQVVCKVHGAFSITPYKHVNRRQGCKACGVRKHKDRQRTKKEAQFISKAKAKFGDKFNYDSVVYTTRKNKVTISCSKHGSIRMTPNSHLASKFGCYACGKESVYSSMVGSLTSFIKRIQDKYSGEVYTYEKSKYITAKDTITVTCMFCGADITNTPDNLLANASSCKCVAPSADGGYKRYLPGTLYYIKVAIGNTFVYKIGITNRSVEDRFTSAELDKITILKTWSYANGEEAAKEERRILDLFKVYRAYGIAPLKSGNTELFDRDILELDVKDSDEV